MMLGHKKLAAPPAQRPGSGRSKLFAFVSCAEAGILSSRMAIRSGALKYSISIPFGAATGFVTFAANTPQIVALHDLRRPEARFPLRSIILGLGLLSLVASLSGQGISIQKLPSQWNGPDNGGLGFSTAVIRNQAAWHKFWVTHKQASPRDLNANEMAVSIDIGTQPTGGYRPRVLAEVINEGSMEVQYIDGKPSAAAIVTQALTHPWVVAIIPAGNLPVVFIKSNGEMELNPRRSAANR
jgi:hypothetical protein